ncbi:MAG: filamentous hemagglutinin N-terminal domain-containing protein [Phycisphaeraceae bacterium]
MIKTRTTTRLMLGAAMMLAASAAFAEVQPTAATDGVAFDSPSAGVTNITAPNNAIIDYARFDVAAGQSVNFIQPDAAARVLNRINSATPSQINGTITANGVVYFVNPAGVQFGPNSVVDAAAIYAAAGSLSDSDFLAGEDRFTSVTGDITQRGKIRADLLAALIGRSVTNTGTISVPDGTAVLASGDQVLIGSPRGGIMLQVDATPNQTPGEITQDGTIDANEISLVSGDLFSLALEQDVASEADFTPPVTLEQIDTDGDGDIDNDDVRTAFANFTGPLPPGTGGKTQQDGDTDGDGDVDNDDIATLFVFFTGPVNPPPGPPPAPPVDPNTPAGEFDLSSADSVARLPAIGETVNLTEADLSILRDQLGIAARSPLPEERVEKVQARALYDDLRARTNGAPNPDGSLVIANTRLDADVVREALTVYRQRLAIEGVSPTERQAQIREAVNTAYQAFAQSRDDQGFDAQAFGEYLQQQNAALLDDLGALHALSELTQNMGLNALEKENSEQTIVNRARPGELSFEQMKETLEAAGTLSLAPASTEAVGESS